VILCDVVSQLSAWNDSCTNRRQTGDWQTFQNSRNEQTEASIERILADQRQQFRFDSLARSRRYSVVIGPWESAKARFNSAHGVPMGVYVWQWGSCVPLEPPMERDPAGDSRAIEFQAPQWTELSAMWAVVPGQSRTKSQMVCEELHSSGKRQVRDLVQPDAWLDSAPASTLALDPTVLGTSGTVLLSF